MKKAKTKRSKSLFLLLRTFFAWYLQRREWAQHRRELLDLDDRLLKDIGLCRRDVIAMTTEGWFRTNQPPQVERLELPDAPTKFDRTDYCRISK